MYFASWVERDKFLKQYQEAIKDFDKAIELDLKYSVSWYFEVDVNILKQYQEAIIDLDKAIELDPEYSDSWDYRGSCKYWLKQYQEAVKDFNKAMNLS